MYAGHSADVRSGGFSHGEKLTGHEISAELNQLELHLVKGLPLCRVVRIPVQMATPLALILQEHILRGVQVKKSRLGSFDTRHLSRVFGKSLIQLLDLELQLIE